MQNSQIRNDTTNYLIPNLSENEQIVLIKKIKEKEKEQIAFSRHAVVIYDFIIKDTIDKYGGLPIIDYAMGDFDNRDFVPISDPKFFEAFKVMFEDLNEANGYKWIKKPLE